MYADSISRFKTMGDVDVVWHDGTYHLFHLVLPNHDFIAHAVSKDGLNWERIENAVFVGHPGSWDDHMLWTMHVTKDPHQPGWWRMFYTGLSRRDSGTIQRIGMARSKDLTHWEKAPDFWTNGKTRSAQGPSFIAGSYDENSSFPLAAKPPHYEHEAESGRRWISFRDPFFFSENGKGIIIMSARTGEGPFIRRGCLGAAEEVEPNRFELTPPIHHPGLYEDIEVPNLLKLNDRYYLIGSIREDAKVRYWHTSSLNNHWSNFYDNVLLPAGNYAARISHDDRGPLIWNFFTANPFKRSRNNLMPPPKRLTTGKS
ncbi:MAG: glycosyl hydrolase, partial [Acidimicrobiia bacterium]|nr:glycosyl hydrolase [Acidimicrobiia bacterium]